MRFARPLLGIAAILGGLASLGAWLLFHVGALAYSPEVATTRVVMYAGVPVFLMCVGGIAYLTEEQNGARSLVRCFLFLVGALGLPVVLFYVILGRGAILQFAEIDMLLLALLCLLGFYFLGNKNAT